MRVGGGEGGVVWEDSGDTGGKWKQVSVNHIATYVVYIVM